MAMRMHAALGSLFLLTLAAGPAFPDPVPAKPVATQMAEQQRVLGAREIEERLYEQGYHRISHLGLEPGAYTARALDGNRRPVFLGVAPDTGEVIEAHPMR